MYLSLLSVYYIVLENNEEQFLKISNDLLEKNRDEVILKYVNYNLANFYFSKNQIEKAKEYAKKALKYNPFYIKAKNIYLK
jgi:tetratricopeptide (TPR) repeat protein